MWSPKKLKIQITRKYNGKIAHSLLESHIVWKSPGSYVVVSRLLLWNTDGVIAFPVWEAQGHHYWKLCSLKATVYWLPFEKWPLWLPIKAKNSLFCQINNFLRLKAVLLMTTGALSPRSKTWKLSDWPTFSQTAMVWLYSSLILEAIDKHPLPGTTPEW